MKSSKKLKSVLKSPVSYNYHNVEKRNQATETEILSLLSSYLSGEDKHVIIGLNSTFKYLKKIYERKIDFHNDVLVFLNVEDFCGSSGLSRESLLHIPVKCHLINGKEVGNKVYLVALPKLSEGKLCKALKIKRLACCAVSGLDQDNELVRLVKSYVNECKVEFL